MTIQKQIEALDEKYPGWDVYRTSGREWRVTVNADTQKYGATYPLLSDALADVLDWIPLPVVPQKPPIYYMDHFSVKKENCWSVYYNHQSAGVQFKTKKAALAWAEQAVKISEKNSEDWDDKWGWCRHKTEGVDFRFT